MQSTNIPGLGLVGSKSAPRTFAYHFWFSSPAPTSAHQSASAHNGSMGWRFDFLCPASSFFCASVAGHTPPSGGVVKKGPRACAWHGKKRNTLSLKKSGPITEERWRTVFASEFVSMVIMVSISSPAGRGGGRAAHPMVNEFAIEE